MIKHIVIMALIVSASLIVYSNTFQAEFQFDDNKKIVENRGIHDLDNLPKILKWHRGVSYASFVLNYAAGKLNVFGYHLVNLIIHVMNGIMAYFLVLLTVRRVKLTSSYLYDASAEKIAALTALIFTVHPMQTQAVTYIVQRMESLSALFYLMALLLFIKGVTSEKIISTTLIYSGVLLSYFVGFHSKEIVITMPVIILLYDLCFFCSGSFKGLLRRWPLYAILFMMILHFAASTLYPGYVETIVSTPVNKTQVASSVYGAGKVQTPEELTTIPSAGFGVATISSEKYLLTQFNVLMTYIRLIALPINQNLDYDYPRSETLFEFPTFFSFLAVMSLISLAITLFIKARKTGSQFSFFISFFILWFFVILSPTSSFIPIKDVITEHRPYLPSLGLIAIFVILLEHTVRGPGRQGKENL